MRRIFIGDIQGCREELELLLEEVHFDPAADELEPVGDFVNRGPDSLGCLRLLRRLDAGGVLGNHDVHLLRVARGERKEKPRDTLRSVLEADDRDELLEWLAERPFVKGWPDALLVHAALNPAWRDPERELAGGDPSWPDTACEFAIQARYCTADGERPAFDDPPPPAPFRPWFEHWIERSSDPRIVVWGHWARMGLVVQPRLRGLDTGCVWGGKLSAWIAEEDRIVQVDALRTWARPGNDP